MATTLAFKDIIDIPVWEPVANAVTANAAGAYIAEDMRNNDDSDPYAYYLTSATTFSAYNVKNNEWVPLSSPALTGTFGAGACAVVHPSQGPRGTLAAGWSTTQGALTTALPATVGINQLANRGDGRGYKIRIVGKGSGKTEERLIVANTASTTPTITLSSALSFTPASGDTYEILSGRVFLLSAGTLAAGMWKYYDIATNSYSGNLATTNLPATVATESAAVALSELHVPYNRDPGEGFVVGAGTYNGALLECLTATAATGTTLTGQAAAGDAGVAANEYRNFQIRIVEDTTNVTAVGQRRNITSHTAGASPVYTVATWTVTPSATCKFVIENNDDRILLWSSTSTSTFTYNITANTWDTSTFGVRTTNGGGVKAYQAFGIVPDAQKLSKPSMIYSFRGAAGTGLDVLDIAAAATGTWSNGVTYGKTAITFTTGTCASYDPATNQGRYMYINQSSTQRNYRLDMLNRVLEPWATWDYANGTAVNGERSVIYTFADGATKLSFWMQIRASDVYGWRVALHR